MTTTRIPTRPLSASDRRHLISVLGLTHQKWVFCEFLSKTLLTHGECANGEFHPDLEPLPFTFNAEIPTLATPLPWLAVCHRNLTKESYVQEKRGLASFLLPYPFAYFFQIPLDQSQTLILGNWPDEWTEEARKLALLEDRLSKQDTSLLLFSEQFSKFSLQIQSVRGAVSRVAVVEPAQSDTLIDLPTETLTPSFLAPSLS